jgi:hypothetical protein
MRLMGKMEGIIDRYVINIVIVNIMFLHINLDRKPMCNY